MTSPVDNIDETTILGGIARLIADANLYKKFGVHLRSENIFRDDKSNRAKAVREVVARMHEIYKESHKSELNRDFILEQITIRLTRPEDEVEIEIKNLLQDMFEPDGTIQKTTRIEGKWTTFVRYIKATIIASQVGKAINQYKNFSIESSVGSFKDMLDLVNRLTVADDYEFDVNEIDDLLNGNNNFMQQHTLSLGWSIIDAAIGHFEPQSLNLFIAATGGGKSMMTHHLIQRAIFHGLRVHVTLVEDRPRSFTRRLIAGLTGIPLSRLGNGCMSYLTAEEKNKINEQKRLISQYVKVEFCYGQSVDYVHSKKIEYDQWCRENNQPIPVVDIVDYTGHIARLSGGDKVHEQMRAAYGARKDFALKYSKIAFDFAQVNREGAKKNEMQTSLSAEDLAGAFDLAQVADNIISINRNIADKNNNQARLFLSKVRDGHAGGIFSVNTKFDRAQWDLDGCHHINARADQKQNLLNEPTQPTFSPH